VCGWSGGGALARLPVVVFEPVVRMSHSGSLCRVRLVRELTVLVYLVSFVFEPFGLVSLLLVLPRVPTPVLVYLILTSLELSTSYCSLSPSYLTSLCSYPVPWYVL